MIKIQLIHTILQESRSGEMSKSSSCWLLLRPEDSSRCRVFSWELRGLHRRCQRGSYQTKYLMKTLDKLIHRFPILSQRRNVWKCPSRFACKLRNRWKESFIALTDKALKICSVPVPDHSFLVAWFLILSFYPSTLFPPITKTLLLCPRCRSKCARWWTRRGSPSSPRWSAPSTRLARRDHRNQVSPF